MSLATRLFELWKKTSADCDKQDVMTAILDSNLLAKVIDSGKASPAKLEQLIALDAQSPESNAAWYRFIANFERLQANVSEENDNPYKDYKKEAEMPTRKENAHSESEFNVATKMKPKQYGVCVICGYEHTVLGFIARGTNFCRICAFCLSQLLREVAKQLEDYTRERL